MFNKGDKVLCIKTTGNYIEGNIYTAKDECNIYHHEGSWNYFFWSFHKWFVRLADYREKQLNNILND